MFALLESFVAREGHARVPQRYEEADCRLGSWVSSQRVEHRKGTLTEDRVAALEALAGWTWRPHDEVFERGFAALQRFASDEGHLRVARGTTIDGIELSTWIINRRSRWRRGKLREDHAAALESLAGWSWEPFDTAFEQGLTALRQFVAREGHADVPATHVENGYKLGTWVATKRNQRRQGKLSADRIAVLDAVPHWNWEPTADNFQRGLEALQHFVEREGHALVPQKHAEDHFPLGSWVSKRRASHRAGQLAADQVACLEAIPHWSWNPLMALM